MSSSSSSSSSSSTIIVARYYSDLSLTELQSKAINALSPHPTNFHYQAEQFILVSIKSTLPENATLISKIRTEIVRPSKVKQLKKFQGYLRILKLIFYENEFQNPQILIDTLEIT
jgi:hypothetical protein